MASAFCKILASITVPTGGWDLVIVDGGGSNTATVPAGVYDSVYDLGKELQDQIQAIPGRGNDIVMITAGGHCVIIAFGVSAYTWASSDADLYEALGFAGDETVASNAVVATSPISHSWFPGTLTRGTSDGAGVISDSGWTPENPSRSAVSGSGRTREIGPSRPPVMRDIRIGLVNSTELNDRTRGPKIFLDRHRYSRLLWVPDRDDYYLSTTLTAATQGDPGYPYYQDDDDAVTYWQVTLSRDPDIRRDQTRQDLAAIGLRFNAEPK